MEENLELEYAKSLLKKEIKKHLLLFCTCDQTVGPCYAALFLTGVIGPRQIVEDANYG